jgi:hypothetical protein
MQAIRKMAIATARAGRQRKAPGSYIVDRNPEDNMGTRATQEGEVETGPSIVPGGW